MGAPLALMVLTALVAAGRNAASLQERPPAVPSPTGILVTSKNFRTVLHWQYPSMSETPRFVVEVKPYHLGNYTTVSTCVNISATSCDLSDEIKEIFLSYWFRIKAIVGSQQSEYIETNEFVLQRHGKIGPPKLNLSRHGAEIIVDIYNPEFPSVEVQPWLEEVYSQLSYSVMFRNSENESGKTFTVADCEMSECSLNIPVPSEGSMYCVSANGHFYDDLIVGAQSEESCIWVPPKQAWSTLITIIVSAIILIVGLTLTVCYGCKKLRKKNIKLPKSLVSVIRNLNLDNSFESRSEAKDICAVSVMPVPSVGASSSMNDDEALLNMESEEEAVTPENFSEGTSSGPPLEASDKVEETSVREDTEVPSDAEQNHKESNFISDSSRTDVCGNSSGPVISATEIRQAVIPSSCPKFSGYDKPHVPLDMLIDVGEEQPVIAYRSTE
ncbi:interferon gamma receptor 1 [Tympanuchus pallidicinctus]|uniref:interferon gamma receptor 1 n=1 Tax=Tympanuchus pallidicinctus TaxID=109042 RepID=UPI0022873F58|nr:interferon gamma receptor 1 [Tympanuchus pallidicinctus]